LSTILTVPTRTLYQYNVSWSWSRVNERTVGWRYLITEGISLRESFAKHGHLLWVCACWDPRIVHVCVRWESTWCSLLGNHPHGVHELVGLVCEACLQNHMGTIQPIAIHGTHALLKLPHHMAATKCQPTFHVYGTAYPYSFWKETTVTSLVRFPLAEFRRKKVQLLNVMSSACMPSRRKAELVECVHHQVAKWQLLSMSTQP
jgi:hypothetical protein